MKFDAQGRLVAPPASLPALRWRRDELADLDEAAE